MISMKNNEYERICELLKSMGRSDLISQRMLLRSFDEVYKIITMPEWEEEKFQGLLTSNIWNSNYEEIKKIITMPEWEDKKFQGLLTSNIWKSNYEEIKKIITMPEWEEEKFQGLLTSTIWNSNYQDIMKKIYLPYWKENKYLQLLVPSIFSISIKSIEEGIKLLKQYDIDMYITNRCLRLKTDFLKKLIDYLIENNIDLVTLNRRTNEYGLNPILSCEKGQLKKKYNIDVEKIEKGGFSK